MADRDHHIRVIAYRLWEEAGRPEGQDEYFWHVAVERYTTELAPSGRVSHAEPASKKPALETEPPVSKAKPETPAPKKRTPAKPKSVAAESAAEPEKPEPESKAAKAQEDEPKPGKAKTKKAKDEAPATASWIKSEPTAKPKGGKRKP
jgi:hypothetical protein